MLPFDPSIQYPTSHCFLRDMHEMMKLGKRRTASFDGRGEESDKSVVLITYKRELAIGVNGFLWVRERPCDD